MRRIPGPNAIFVYGTLKRGGCNVGHWPVAPTRILPGTICGALYDLGAYPGLVAGEERIAGECWFFADRDLPRVMAAIDALEDHRGRADDEYRRERVVVRLDNGFDQRAWTYRYQRPVGGRQRIAPGTDGSVAWEVAALPPPTLGRVEPAVGHRAQR